VVSLGRLALSGDPSYRTFLEWAASLANPQTVGSEELESALAFADDQGIQNSAPTVPDDEIRRAVVSPEEFLELRTAIEQIRSFHEKELAALTKGLTRTSSGWSWRTSLSGFQTASSLGRRWLPLERVGIVLEGTLREVPSLLNFSLAARVAGVEECVVAWDPACDASAQAVLRVAAREVGARTLLRLGGLKAVALLATGTEDRGPCSLVACSAPGARTLQSRFPNCSFAELSPDGLTCVLAMGEFDRQAAARAWIGGLAEGRATGGAVLVLSDRNEVDALLTHAEGGISSGEWGDPEVVRAAAAERGWVAVLPGETHALDLVQSLNPSNVIVFTTDPERTALSLTTASQVQIGPATLQTKAYSGVVGRPTVADFLRVQTVTKFAGR